MRIDIDYVEDRPGDVDVTEVGGQVSIDLPDVRIYLYPAVAKALRDALVKELGAPEGYLSEERAAELIDGLTGPSRADEHIPDDKGLAYRDGYKDAQADAAEALANK